jgi:hypothetical protein
VEEAEEEEGKPGLIVDISSGRVTNVGGVHDHHDVGARDALEGCAGNGLGIRDQSPCGPPST